MTNCDRHTGEGSLVAVVSGTRSEDVMQVLRQIDEEERMKVEDEEMEECKHSGKPYEPFSFSNGDTRPELLIRNRYLLFKSADKWTEKQKERAKILFDEYPDIKMAYGLSHSLRMIFSKNTIKDAARLSMVKWYDKVDSSRMKQFNVIAETFYEYYDER